MRKAAFLFLAATFVIAAGNLATFSATAQDAGARALNAGGQPPKNPSPANPPSLEVRLNQRVDIDFVETPLRDVVDFLRDSTGIQFVLNLKKLDEAGVSVDAAITKSLKQVRLVTALDLLLEELELTYVEKDELLVITTPEDAESKLVIRVYDCRDLLALEPPKLDQKQPAGSGVSNTPATTSQADVPSEKAKEGNGGASAQGQGAMGCYHGEDQGLPARTEFDSRVDELIELIEISVNASKWDTVGGPGSISNYRGLIVITQTAQTHKRVERLLDMLRYAAGFAGSLTEKVVR